MKAIISHQPYNKYMGLPDEIESIDITHCLMAINHLSQIAKLVSSVPDGYGSVAQQMAYLIRQIEMSLEPQLTELKIKMKEDK